MDEYNLCNILGYNGRYPWYVVHKTEECYSTFWINKENKQIVTEYNEDLNLREISAPTTALKVLQGRLAAAIFKKLPMHPANFAYMTGKNVRQAAEAHEENDVLIRIDLKNFFPMHNEPYVRNKLRQLTGYSKEVCWFITKLCSLRGELPQGSVTSPILSIILNYDMDERLSALATQYGLVYTRYADDLCFSGKDKGNKIFWEFIRLASTAIHPFKINWNKVEIMRNSSYRFLNGIEVLGTTDINVTNLLTLVQDFENVKVKPNSVVLRTYGEFNAKHFEECAKLLLSNSLTFKPVFYYVQSIKRLLGMNLTDGIKYPRNKYIEMRMTAKLVANGATNVNLAQFRGRLSFMRLVDKNKASKIDAILNKSSITRKGGVIPNECICS